MSIRADVDRGLAIVQQMATLQKELDDIETRLERAGLEGDQIELVDPEREGRQYLAHGSEAIVPIVFTADLLVKSFADRSVTYDRIVGALPKDARIRSFFHPISTWKTVHENGKKFRAIAAEALGAAAPAFITACLQRDKHGLPKSQVRVEWNRAAEHATAAAEWSRREPCDMAEAREAGERGARAKQSQVAA